jgi:Protein of unknown function (DUF3619)
MTNSYLLPNEDQLGRNIAARLNSAVNDIPHDISERLKAARMQALSKRKVVKLQVATGVSSRGGVASLHMAGDERSMWNRVASLLPLLVLIAGLFTIALTAEDLRVDEIAEIDAELLTDDLPPDAYTDPGFAQFLRINHRD